MAAPLFIGLIGQVIATAPAYADGIDFADYSIESGVVMPSVNEDITVSAGEAIATLLYGRVSSGAVLTKGYAEYPEGSLMLRTTSSKPYKACFLKQVEKHDHFCMIDDNNDGKFDRVGSSWFAGHKPLQEKLEYRRVDRIRVPILSPGSTRMILYQGMSGDGLKLSYREFTASDFARPAFTEDISIPLTKEFPQRFAVKGLKFTVIKIDGLGMAFRLDSLNPAQGWPEP